MSDDFNKLIADIETEAKAEGPDAVRELEQLRQNFSLASQLIEGRRDRGLSQRDLAKLSGVPQSEISRIETGADNPTYATITALLQGLGKRIEFVDDGSAIVARRFGSGLAPDALAAPERPKGRSGREPLPLVAGPAMKRLGLAGAASKGCALRATRCHQ